MTFLKLFFFRDFVVFTTFYLEVSPQCHLPAILIDKSKCKWQQIFVYKYARKKSSHYPSAFDKILTHWPSFLTKLRHMLGWPVWTIMWQYF